MVLIITIIIVTSFVALESVTQCRSIVLIASVFSLFLARSEDVLKYESYSFYKAVFSTI